MVLASLTSTAAADEAKQVCSASYEQTQAARKQGKLSVAREKAILCSQDACPAFIKVDCAQWFGEIDASAPTIVLEVQDAKGVETTAARVLIDGSVVKEKLDGSAIVVDPGEHTVRVELLGAPPKEQRLLAREGEKNRKVLVSFVGTPAALAPIPSLPGGETTNEPKKGAPAIAYVLGGVGVVGIGLFATFGILGRNGKSDLQKTCAPYCKSEQVDAVRAKLIAADVSLGVGVASLGVATYLFVAAPSARPTKPPSSLNFTATPISKGAVGAVGGSF